jgi:membrane associated rhomboid family serine protease
LIPLKDNIPTSRFPIVTVVLIVINLVVFGWQLSFSGDEASSPELQRAGVSERDQNSVEFGAIPFRLTHPGRDCSIAPDSAQIVCEGTDAETQAEQAGSQPVELNEPPWWVTIWTSMFMHGGFLHIAFNMLFLWIFGNNVEDAMGRPRYLAFYLLAGAVAVYAQSLIHPAETTPTIGASGAIAGVLGAYALLYPRARVLTLLFIIFFVTLVEIPALVMLGIWFILQFLPAVGQLGTSEVGGHGGTAYFAHLGGFIFGLSLIRLFVLGRRGIIGRKAF